MSSRRSVSLMAGGDLPRLFALVIFFSHSEAKLLRSLHAFTTRHGTLIRRPRVFSVSEVSGSRGLSKTTATKNVEVIRRLPVARRQYDYDLRAVHRLEEGSRMQSCEMLATLKKFLRFLAFHEVLSVQRSSPTTSSHCGRGRSLIITKELWHRNSLPRSRMEHVFQDPGHLHCPQHRGIEK